MNEIINSAFQPIAKGAVYYPVHINHPGFTAEETTEFFYRFIPNFIKKEMNVCITQSMCGCVIGYDSLPQNSRKCMHGNYFVKYSS